MWFLVAVLILTNGNLDVSLRPMSGKQECQEKAKELVKQLNGQPSTELSNIMLFCREVKIV